MNITTSFDDLWVEYCSPKDINPNAPTQLDKFTHIMQLCFDRAKNLKMVVIRGSTPYFNDGDPCRHSSEVAYVLDGKRFSDPMDGYMLFESGEYQLEDPNDPEGEGWESDAPFWDYDINELNYDNMKIDKKVLQLIESQGLDSSIWNTNYTITITRNDNGSVNIVHEEFEPSY